MRWRTRIGLAAVTFLVVEPFVRIAVRRGPPTPAQETVDRAERVSILRDRWGVPHVFGPTDADAAFGLAYAHAEDDFPMIQGILAASRGRLGLLNPGKQALLNDGYAALIDVEGEIARHYGTLDPHVRDVFEAYAEGLGFYAFHHPDEVDSRLLPFTGSDVARGFVHKLPLMLGLPDVLKGLTNGTPEPPVMPGSNAHAIAPWRSTDGVTRLNVNSHQPWEGPVTWYEAQVHSDEGWDMAGGLFPGSPMVLHGSSEQLGWALTVNTADRIDVYRLVTDGGDTYRYGADELPFESSRAWLPIDTPWLTVWVPKTFRRTVHGPVIDTDHGTFAVRHVGQDQGVRAGEQWFRMNKATDLGSFRDAMAMVAIPMFNVVYADAEHVWYLYNARVPDTDVDRAGVLAGDDPADLWTEVLPLDRLPQVLDPASGFVQACNSTPYRATLGPGNPVPDAFPASAGIETRVTARSLRTFEILADGAPVGREEFLALKWDRRAPLDAPIRELLIAPLVGWVPDDPDTREAAAQLLAWDGVFDESSVGATIAVLAWRELDAMGWKPEPPFDPRDRVAFAASFLREHHGRIDVPLGDVQRLIHGDVDLPLGGGPDVLNCTYHHIDDGRLVGDQGDSYVQIAEFGARPRTWSIHQYGASLRPDSPHYSDQAPLFVDRRLKPLLRDRTEIRAFLEAEYHPGEAWTPVGMGSPTERLADAEALWHKTHPEAEVHGG